jgi:hypothetical protein
MSIAKIGHVDVIGLCQWLTVKGKCQYEGNTDIESERTEQSNGIRPNRE